MGAIIYPHFTDGEIKCTGRLNVIPSGRAGGKPGSLTRSWPTGDHTVQAGRKAGDSGGAGGGTVETAEGGGVL